MRKKLVLLVAMLCLLTPITSPWAAGEAQSRIQIVDENGVPVRDAVVEITPARGSRGSFRLPGQAVMAQKDLQFTPGTLVVSKETAVAFPNLDRVRHSIYSFSKAAQFEIDLYGRDQTRAHTNLH